MSSQEEYNGDGPAYNTRSSHLSQPSLSQQSNAEEVIGTGTYEVLLEPLVKQTVAERIASSRKLTVSAFGGKSWNEIKTKIFERYKTHFRGFAQLSEGGVWSVSDRVASFDVSPRCFL